jgi:hypothetical protein
MAKTDRNPEYMEETFGTKFLVTDCAADQYLAPKPTTLEEIVEVLEEILSVPYGEYVTREGYTPGQTDQTQENFVDDVINFGYSTGVYQLAEQLLPKLKALQNQQ